MRKNIDNIEAEARANRQEILTKMTDIFAGTYGAVVTPIGSMSSTGKQDFLSDIDAWVSVPDDAIDEVLQRRNELYAGAGNELITWERPSYAPLGGMHSIVLYDGEKTVSPTEIDYFIAPASKDEYYKEYIAGGGPDEKLEWRIGADDQSLGARLDYTALVTMWAGKYWHRRIDRQNQLEWATRRFTEVTRDAELCSDIPDSLAGTIGTLTLIIDSLHEKVKQLEDPKRMRAYQKIAHTISLVEALETES